MLDQIEARLARIEVGLTSLMHRSGQGKRVLITGGTGTLGTALTRRFLDDGYTVTVLSRNAQHQAEYLARYPDVRCFLADICDYAAVREACTGQNVVIHAAALKRVDTAETHIAETARVNIDGTRTVIQACRDALVERAVFISSDKAVQPLNFYGITKAAGERLWCASNAPLNFCQTRFACVRYGNVMGSNGSVLQLWRRQLQDGCPITVRDPETSRFCMTLERAVGLITFALERMQGGEIFVPADTPAFWLHDLARTVASEETWLRDPLGPREKVHEVLLAPGECVEYASRDTVIVWPQRAGDAYVPPQFTSQGTRRLTGEETVKLLE